MTMYFVNTKLKANTSQTRRRSQLGTPSTRSSPSATKATATSKATTATATASATTTTASILKSCYSLVIFGLVLATCLSCCQCSGHLPDSHQHHTHKQQHRQITQPAPVACHHTGREHLRGETKLINYDTKAGANSSVRSGQGPQVAPEEAPGDGVQRPERAGSEAAGDRQQQELPANRPEETLHKLMSEKDLRRTFQVETHDQVPEYQVLKLTVSSDGSHLISPISDLGELLITSNTNDQGRHHRAGSLGEPGGQSQVASTDEARDDSSRNSNDIKRNHINKETSAEEAHTIEGGADGRPSRVKRAAAAAADMDGRAKAAPHDDDEDQRLIVMNLSTFGQDFSLRLKRNADFQQRIKDMKMFLAESTGDGQLRYTEIQQAQQHRKQEPHKRAADSSEDSRHQQQVPPEPTATTNTSASNKDKTTTTAAPNSDWHNIGSTYHDETNLAALLIERDRQTGRIQVDGTIGNEFVIKPMPHGALEALRAKHSTGSAGATTEADAAAKPELNAIGVERMLAASSGNELKQAAAHMHDDDPHDDDEMFLDEDEALELAAGRNGPGGQQAAPANQTDGQQPQQQAPRVLSKAASERKLRKHRKLLQAQTQVPKLAPMETSGAATGSHDALSPDAVAAQRARRHAAKSRTTTTATGNTDQDVHSKQPEHFHMSHHIIYKQRPSSEASSSEHQHSFMFAPGQRDMEQLVADVGAAPGVHLARAGQATDYAHDPLGGQFYLEPGSVTGFERAGHSDWSFSTRGRGRALPALNSTASGSTNVTSEEAWLGSDQPAGDSAEHARFKRHLAGGGGGSGHSRLRPAGSHQQRRLVTPQAQHEPNASRRRHKRQAPDVVWPEVLLVVDYDSFLLHGGDSREVKRYFVSFWNGVDLRYKLLVNPHIRISLAGMIVAKDRDATPYLERNRLRAPNADAVDAAGALTDMGKYLYREDRLPTYDLAVVITKLDMCRRRFEGGRCNRGTAGFAYVGGACVVNKRLEKVNSVAIIEDSGGFSGIIVAAHEVGHLLGCVHDGSPPPSYLGGPGATHCPWEDGFIMSDLRHTERGFRWSSCSVEQFKHFLNGETATCLYNYPHESQMLHRLLPGSMLSLDDQCKRDRGTNACFKDQRVCAQLFCFDSASGYCVSYRPAAEGSPCGDGMVCRNGKCVGEIENIIPDYTHQSQTVVATTGARQRALAAGLPVPAAATASVSSALVPARLTDALSTSSSSTSAALEGASGKSTATTLAAGSASSSGAKSSERRMDTFPVDTPTLGTRFQTTESNYLAGGNYQQQQQQRQTPMAHYSQHHHSSNSNGNNNNQNHQFQTTEHSNLNHKQQARYQKLTTASNNLNTNHGHNGNRVQNRKRDQTSAVTRPSEMLHVAASSSSGQSPGPFSSGKRVPVQQQHVGFVGGPLNQPRRARTLIVD